MVALEWMFVFCVLVVIGFYVTKRQFGPTAVPAPVRVAIAALAIAVATGFTW